MEEKTYKILNFAIRFHRFIEQVCQPPTRNQKVLLRRSHNCETAKHASDINRAHPHCVLMRTTLIVSAMRI
uniref:Uncharacterized protein n=1 Tax=Anopheles dirus TaxID=7168 RepID=A0A182NW75_9DIPT